VRRGQDLVCARDLVAELLERLAELERSISGETLTSAERSALRELKRTIERVLTDNTDRLN
jgi:hypothetical protein